MSPRPRHGINRRDYIDRVVALGGTVTEVRRTGEVTVRHPVMGHRHVILNVRRKDVSRSATHFLFRIEQALARQKGTQHGPRGS